MGSFQKMTPDRGRLHLPHDDRLQNQLAVIHKDLPPPPPPQVPADRPELLRPRTSAPAVPVSTRPQSPAEGEGPIWEGRKRPRRRCRKRNPVPPSSPASCKTSEKSSLPSRGKHPLRHGRRSSLASEPRCFPAAGGTRRQVIECS